MGDLTKVGENAIVRRLADAQRRGEAQANLGEAIEMVLIQGDLAKLKPEERVTYYNRVCESLGLNPLTKPFAYINLNGKLTLYALKDATEQLRKIHGVSIERLETERHSDLYVVKAYAKDRTGRTDASTGAVPLGNLKGEALANAIMKCETKAKRRATLSICGLGMLDEVEVESIEPQREPLVIDAPKPVVNFTPAQALADAVDAQIVSGLQHAADAARAGAAALINATPQPPIMAAPCAQPLYAMQVAMRPGKFPCADVTFSDGSIRFAKGDQMIGFLSEACQNQTPLDVTSEKRIVKKTGEELNGILDVKVFKQTIREELEASVAAGPPVAPAPAEDEEIIPF